MIDDPAFALAKAHLHHTRPDGDIQLVSDEELAVFARALIAEIRLALASTLRRMAAGRHDLSVTTPAQAYLKAAELVDSVLTPDEEVAS